MATEQKTAQAPAAPKRKYMVNWKLTMPDGELNQGDTIELTDAELKALGLTGSGVLSRMRTAAEQKAAEEAEAKAKAEAEAEAAKKT